MSNSSHATLMPLAEQAAREAAQLLRTRQGTGLQDVVSSKGRDIKLQSDQEAEKVILRILQSQTSIPILTEESGEHGATQDAPEFWIVDPLDGSMNYNRGIPLTCISIALWKNGKPHMGVVYDFVRDELFSAEVGQGAWLNGNPMRVSTVTTPSQGVLATGIPSKLSLDDSMMTPFTDRMRAFKKVRMLGTAALMLSWVACGRVDAYAEENIMLWDVAAGLALVEAAGGWTSCVPGTGKWQFHARAAASQSLFPNINGLLTPGNR